MLGQHPAPQLAKPWPKLAPHQYRMSPASPVGCATLGGCVWWHLPPPPHTSHPPAPQGDTSQARFLSPAPPAQPPPFLLPTPQAPLGPQEWGGREVLAPPRVPKPSPGMYLLIRSRPEDSQDEDSGDGRSQVACDSLDVDVELAAAGALQDGDPDHAEGHQHHRDHPASGSDAVQGDAPVPPAPPCTHGITMAVGGPQGQGLGPSASAEEPDRGYWRIGGRMLIAG